LQNNQYHVYQYYSDRLSEEGDTIYVNNGSGSFATKLLPSDAGHELIWVQGVCWIDGIVSGAVTVLASDTMFIMDNIITADAELNNFSNDAFGTVPLGSPNRIGLASEGNIVIASTYQNGFADGAVGNPACDSNYDPVEDSNIGNVFGQGRRDVIISAALFAVGCSFEAEFWNTAALSAVPRPLMPQEDPDLCGPTANTHTHVWSTEECPTANMDDRRGTIYLHGSIVQTHRGFVRRSITSWNADIGYANKVYRYDDNFLAGGPPVWFNVTYTDGSQAVTTEMVVPDYDRWMANRELRGIIME
jgi:hypothetical protein